MLTKRTGVVFLAIAILVSGLGDAEASERIKEGWTVPLEKLGINGSMARLSFPQNWRTKQVSSYDRTGGDSDDRFGEHLFDGGVVMADLEGPGSVMRIWTRNPQGTLHIYIDDMEHPLLTADFADMFRGIFEVTSPGTNLFSPPMAGEGNGGYYSYVPIPYANRCRIVATGVEDSLTYQVTYAEFTKGTPIESFKLSLTDDDINYFQNWREEWDDSNQKRVKSKTEKLHKSRHNYWPNKNSLIFPLEGPGVIRELKFKVESADPEILQKTWLSISFDGQKKSGVYAPIGTFFGATSPNSGDFTSLAFSKSGDTLSCKFPMPFGTRAEIRVITTSAEIADITYWIRWESGKVDGQHYFFARYNSSESVVGEPYRVAELSGDGHFVGSTIGVKQADSLRFLNGDDIYLVDGDSGSNFHGTGTDDYFNAGWYFSSGTYVAPTHGTTYKSAKAPTEIGAFRTHVTEAVPFEASFAFDLEHGSQNDSPGVVYSSVCYWYQANREPETWQLPELMLADSD